MEAKRIKMSILFCVSFKKTEISKQLNVFKMTIHWEGQRLRASEFLKDRLRSGRLQVIGHGAIKHAYENDPCQKMARQVQKKKVSVSSLCRMVKKMGRKNLRRSSKSLLSAAMVQIIRCVWRGALVC